MNISEYYRILGLETGCTIDDIKRSYRKIAREYHPDINHNPGADEIFIAATEAYEFLMTNHLKIHSGEKEFEKMMDEWRKYREDMARRRAAAYARASFSRFKKTDFYKATKIFDVSIIIASLIVAVAVLFIAIYGYIYRLNHPLPGIKDPSVFILVLFVLLGMILFIISYIHLKAYLENRKKK